MKRFLIIVLISAPALAADIKQRAQTCIACHGENGISPNELWPNLAGQKKGYLLKQMQAFHNGERYDPLMSPIARMLSSQDMNDLSTYFSEMVAK